MTREEHIKLIAEMIEKSEEEINAMFDSGMFNEIIKGYVQMVLDGKGSIEQLLDEVQSGEARTYYKTH